MVHTGSSRVVDLMRKVQMLDSQGHPAWPKGHTSPALESSSAEVASATKEMLFNSSVDGEAAYEGVYEGEGVLAEVLFVGIANRFFVMTGVFEIGDYAPGEVVFDRMVQSFRARRTP